MSQNAQGLNTPRAGIQAYVRIARPDHWIKQLFILPGVALGLLIVGTQAPLAESIRNVILSLVATSFVASSNYVINEWLDRDFDKFHPVKSKRPAVQTGLDPRIVYTEWAVLGIAGLIVALLINISLFITVAILWLMGIVYNVRPLRTKDIPYLDVLSESLNNALRLHIGWFAIVPNLLPPTSVALGYWMVGAFLMAIKRFSEYRAIGDPKAAGLYRKSFRRYSERSLLDSSLFYAMLSVFLIGVFLVKWRIEYMIAIPFICAVYVKYFNIALKEDSAAQRPEKLFHEHGLMTWVAVVIVLLVLLTIVNIPFLHTLSDVALVEI